MSAKKGKVSIAYVPNKHAPGACVTVSFKTKGCLTMGSVKNPDESAVLMMIKDQICAKIKCEPVSAMQHKVTCVKCCTQGNDYVLSVTCAPSLTSVKKVAISIAKYIYPITKVYYDTNIRKHYGISGNPAAFKAAQSSVTKSIKDGLNFCITGKVNLDSRKLNLIADKTALAFNNARVPNVSSGSDRSVDIQPRIDTIELSLGSALDAVLASFYLRAKLGCVVCTDGSKVVLPAFVEGKLRSLADQKKINVFFKKLMKYKAKFYTGVLYQAAINCQMSATALAGAKSKAPSVTGMASKLK